VSRQPQVGPAQSQVILTSLPGPPEVEAETLGPNGLIEGIE
jgi:3-hydroxyisobutyrate dehydrogenase